MCVCVYCVSIYAEAVVFIIIMQVASEFNCFDVRHASSFIINIKEWRKNEEREVSEEKLRMKQSAYK